MIRAIQYSQTLQSRRRAMFDEVVMSEGNGACSEGGAGRGQWIT